MTILMLGPPCHKISQFLADKGYKLQFTEEKINPDFIIENRIDFAISYRYRHIITSEIIKLFNGRLINLHISLLPWNRGSDPNLWSFLENTPKGVTIHQIDAGLDTGPILLQRQLRFDASSETLRSTYQKLSDSIEDLFIENYEYLLGNKINPIAQSGVGSIHYTKDKVPWLPLLEKSGWDTPISNIEGKALLAKHNSSPK